MSNGDYEGSRVALLKSIYGVDEIGEELKNLPVSRYYEVAAHMHKVKGYFVSNIVILVFHGNCRWSHWPSFLQIRNVPSRKAEIFWKKVPDLKIYHERKTLKS